MNEGGSQSARLMQYGSLIERSYNFEKNRIPDALKPDIFTKFHKNKNGK